LTHTLAEAAAFLFAVVPEELEVVVEAADDLAALIEQQHERQLRQIKSTIHSKCDSSGFDVYTPWMAL
jgi:hypothetical protein